MAKPILVLGASGFVGSRLTRCLLNSGHTVHAASRAPHQLRAMLSGARPVFADVDQLDSLRAAMHGVGAVYDLVHLMGGPDSAAFARRELQAAENLVTAAADAGVDRLIYLGGVAPHGTPSPHLRSRLQTGEILRSGPVPTLELRAGMIVGAQSASWRIVRDLAARLPVMILPRWLENRSQPVAIDDVIAALSFGLEAELPHSRWSDLPGPDILSSREILNIVARLRGTRPMTVGVPFMTPQMSSYWIAMVTRADPRLARLLVEGLKTDLLAEGPGLWSEMDDHAPMSFIQAATLALEEECDDLGRRTQLLEGIVRRVSRSAS
ncbi:MAG: NAD(P)H-binding protein [Myxococcota bacterium]